MMRQKGVKFGKNILHKQAFRIIIAKSLIALRSNNMKGYISLLLIVLSSIAVDGQNQRPAASPTPSSEDVVKISTSLIQLDVTITDKKGKILTDIQPNEVEIFENGKKQQISNFSFERGAVMENPASEAKKEEPQQVYVPRASLKPSEVRRTIAIVVDDITLSFESTFWVRKALREYIEEQVRDGDMVAIIRTAGGIGALQQFTSDRRQLMAAVDKIKFDMRGSSTIPAFEPISPSLKEQLSGEGRGAKDFSEDVRREREMARAIENFRNDAFVSGTLGALNYVIRGMGELPGRKSVVVLSDGLTLLRRDSRGMPQTSVMSEALRRLADTANRAAVVLYSIDARGLVYGGPTASDDFTGMTSEMIDSRLKEREFGLQESQDGLRYLSELTGGFAVLNSNDINRGLQRVLHDGSYYLIGYVPDDETFDSKTARYNRLEVRVTRPDVRVRYRSGFFGIADEKFVSGGSTGRDKALRALASPFAINEISLRLRTLFTAADGKNAIVRSYLHIPAGDLKFEKVDDAGYKATFELVAMSFGDNGVPVDKFFRTFTITLPEFLYRRSLESGIVYQFEIPVKKAGGYQYRLALRDTATDKVGSASEFIEVPKLDNNRLSLSGVVLMGIPRDVWQQYSSGALTEASLSRATDPERDTALRQFKVGTVLRYGALVFNVDRPKNVRGGLNARMRIFKDGKVHFEGDPFTVGVSAAGEAEVTGGIILARDMPPGEYVMQIIVQNALEGSKRSASQFVQFDIVE